MLKHRKRKRDKIWCREHFLLRETRGEYHRTFLHLRDNPDEELFFNYTRMTYRTYDALKSLVLEHLQSGQTNYRSSIEAEQKLIITLRLVLINFDNVVLYVIRLSICIGLLHLSDKIRQISCNRNRLLYLQYIYYYLLIRNRFRLHISFIKRCTH